MKQQEIKAIVWGCGFMGQNIIQYLHQKGINLVGSIDRNISRVGKDAGEVAGVGTLGVLIHPLEEAEQVFKTGNANVCLIATRSLMTDVYPLLEIAAQQGVNAITLSEEAFYPWRTSPDLTQKLDQLAKAHNCTLTGSGFQDVFCGHLVATLTGAVHQMECIRVITRYNLNDYGQAIAEFHGAGLTIEAFQKEIATRDTPAFNWYVNDWLCAYFGWPIQSQKQELIPISDCDIVHATCLDKDIAVGDVTGMKAVVTTETPSGVIIESQTIGKVFASGEVDIHEITVIGQPHTTLTIEKPEVAKLTGTVIVNRIPDVIAAPPGFITTAQMPPPHSF